MATIGEAARRSGLHIETIRFYEREGVTASPGRTAGGRRAYTEDEIERLVFVKRCRDLGFPLPDVSAMLALRNAEHDQCDDVRAISERHIADVRAKIRDLRRLERALVKLVAECREGRADCPALDVLFAAK